MGQSVRDVEQACGNVFREARLHRSDREANPIETRHRRCPPDTLSVAGNSFFTAGKSGKCFTKLEHFEARHNHCSMKFNIFRTLHKRTGNVQLKTLSYVRNTINFARPGGCSVRWGPWSPYYQNWTVLTTATDRQQ